MAKVIVAGHVCLDLTPKFLNDTKIEVESLLQPGSLLRMGELVMSLGGAVNNTGAAFSKLGHHVTAVTKVGEDSFGEIIQKEIAKRVDDYYIKVDPKSTTSYSVVIAPMGVDRIFLHHPGANETFCDDDFDFSRLKEGDLFHFGYPPLMDRLLENNGSSLVQILKTMREKNFKTSVDMVAIDPRSKVAQLDWKQILCHFLPFTNYFLPSAEELAFMIDRPMFTKWKEKAKGQDIIDYIDIEEDLPSLARQLFALQGQEIVIKCGHRGIFYGSPDKMLFQEAFLPQQVASATGAGDVAIAGFLTAILEQKTVEDALELACAMGTACVEKIDFLANYPGTSGVRKRVEKGWATNSAHLSNSKEIRSGLWQIK